MTERLKNVFKQVFKLDEIADNISQANCDKWDSMGHLNLIVEIEIEFDISFEPEEIAMMKDFKAVKELLKKKINL
ncbi:MAG: acyl carrier protein [Prevotellaceae bacterium]|jgi:acyl carrier protein|nr:acyl carrier protein [Prevotellaceae bacterium]